MSQLDDDLDDYKTETWTRDVVRSYRMALRAKELTYVVDSDGRTNSYMASKIARFEGLSRMLDHGFEYEDDCDDEGEW